MMKLGCFYSLSYLLFFNIAQFSVDAQDYESKRDYMVKVLAGVGFRLQFKPQGSIFLFAELPENCSLSDVRKILTSLRYSFAHIIINQLITLSLSI